MLDDGGASSPAEKLVEDVSDFISRDAMGNQVDVPQQPPPDDPPQRSAYDLAYNSTLNFFGAKQQSEQPVTKARQKAADRLAVIKLEQLKRTVLNIGLPAFAAAVIGFLYFDEASRYIASLLDTQALNQIADDDDTGQFVQNFLFVTDLLFAILAANAYTSLYKQQEAIYLALFDEVTVAKSLLEQLTLIGNARKWYPSALAAMEIYVTEDLRRLDVAPSEAVGSKPNDDPLEAIMYMTSVGVLSSPQCTCT